MLENEGNDDENEKKDEEEGHLLPFCLQGYTNIAVFRRMRALLASKWRHFRHFAVATGYGLFHAFSAPLLQKRQRFAKTKVMQGI